jgi:hypothetical protein
MVVNFEIKENYALLYGGRHIDLHNNFDFVDYNYSNALRQLVITWKKAEGKWVNADELQKLTLIHTNVSFVHVSYDHSYEYPNDDRCLADLSFYPSSDRQTNDRIISQNKPDVDDDIIYSFQSGSFIRVGCNAIELSWD